MECIRKGVAVCKRFKPDLMVCLGGGSPLDAGKFIRAQYEHPELTLEQAASRFIELRKRTIEFPKLGSKIRRLVAIPTTSGTGSEVIFSLHIFTCIIISFSHIIMFILII